MCMHVCVCVGGVADRRALGLPNVLRRLCKTHRSPYVPPVTCSPLSQEELKGATWDFPGGPMAKTLLSECRGPGFQPWSGNESPHAIPKSFHEVIRTQHGQISEKLNFFLS